MRLFNPNNDPASIKFILDLTFESVGQFKQAVVDYAIFSGFNVTWKKINAQRVEPCFAKKCHWRIHASWL